MESAVSKNEATSLLQGCSLPSFGVRPSVSGSSLLAASHFSTDVSVNRGLITVWEGDRDGRKQSQTRRGRLRRGLLFKECEKQDGCHCRNIHISGRGRRREGGENLCKLGTAKMSNWLATRHNQQPARAMIHPKNFLLKCIFSDITHAAHLGGKRGLLRWGLIATP